MNISEKRDKTIDCILYIYYLICFKTDNNDNKTLINFNNNVNILTSNYTLKLDV